MYTSMKLGRSLDQKDNKLSKCMYRPIELQLKGNYSFNS